MKRWSKEETNFLESNYQLMLFEDMVPILNRSVDAIRAKCHDMGLVKKEAWSKEEIQFVIDNYCKLPTKQIAEYLNRTPDAVKLKAQRNGLKKYPYSCDYRFFDIIDTEEKAYWLGFIYADGWISVNHKTNSGCVGIELQIRDIEHLRKFNKSLCGNYKIIEKESQCKPSPNKEFRKHCQIRIYSIDMVEDLQKHGITNTKTYDMTFPELPDALIKHFIRGYFDGDGSLYERHRKEYVVPQCNFYSASKVFLESLRKYLHDTGFNTYFWQEKRDEKYVTSYTLALAGKSNNESFLNYIYKDSIVYLDRKYQLSQKYI